MNINELLQPGKTIVMNHRHDHHCKTLKTRDMDDCTCDCVVEMVDVTDMSRAEIGRVLSGGADE
jgi:hypothetical protein